VRADEGREFEEVDDGHCPVIAVIPVFAQRKTGT
jgi:hypothetical protein